MNASTIGSSIWSFRPQILVWETQSDRLVRGTPVSPQIVGTTIRADADQIMINVDLI